MKKYFTIAMVIPLLILARAERSAGQTTYGSSPSFSAPDVASLGKFATYPVSSYTGTLNLSVPLLSVGSGDNTVDIGLIYDASGFIPNKEPGIVGLNWSLLAGGIITRRVHWAPDDRNRSDLEFTIPVGKGFIYGQQTDATRYDKEYIRKLSFLRISQGVPFANLKYEYAPDVFSFSFGGHTGSFFMGNDGQVKVNADRGYWVNVSKMSGQFNLCRDLLPSEITITTADGDRYVFGGDRSALDITYPYTHTDKASIGCKDGVITAWRLRKITGRNGREINFHYQEQSREDWALADTEHGIPTHVDYAYTKVYRNEHVYLYEGSQGNDGENTIGTLYRSLIKTCYLNRIETDHAVMEFGYTKREKQFYGNDVILMNPNLSKYLTEIRLRDKSGTLRERITFAYRLTGADPIGYRQFLTGVNFHNGASAAVDHSYGMEYNNIADNYGFPKPLTRGIDRWGFYNGRDGTATLVPLVNNSPDYEVDWSFRAVDPAYCDFAMLKSIRNPTGGTTAFEYESHGYSRVLKKTVAGGMVPQLRMQEGITGGARIAKITESEGVTRSYRYVEGYRPGATGLKSSGWLVDNGVFYMELIFYYNGNVDEKYAEIQDNNIAASSTYYEAPISYPEVTEVVGNTYTTSYYTGHYMYPDKYYLGDDSYVVSPNPDESKSNFHGQMKRTLLHSSCALERGKLSEEVMWDGNGLPVREIRNTYNSYPGRYDRSVIGFWFPYTKVHFGIYHSYALYHFNNNITKREVIEYENGKSAQRTVTNYLYDDSHRLLKRESTTDSRGRTLVSEFTYPVDSATTFPYSGMVNRYMISPVISRTDYLNGARISLRRTNYHNPFFGIYVPFTVQEGKGSRRAETRAIFRRSDNLGNPLEVETPGSTSEAYLWGYGGRYPVATVRNAKYGQIGYTGFESDGPEGSGNFTYRGTSVPDATAPGGKMVYNLGTGDLSGNLGAGGTRYALSYWAKSPSAGNISGAPASPVRSHNGWTLYRRRVEGVTSLRLSGAFYIDEVRLYPIEAEMTTYSYDPIHGMTGSTDAADRTTRYEYDGFGRMLQLRDGEGKIIERYDYKYRDQ